MRKYEEKSRSFDLPQDDAMLCACLSFFTYSRRSASMDRLSVTRLLPFVRITKALSQFRRAE
jgi:hypothetical protein